MAQADVLVPRVSVVIVTHNRGHLVTKALDGLRQQTCPRSAFEIIVVDNASTDDTAERVQPYVIGDTNFRYIVEHTLGSSVARNTGWKTARAPIVAFLDDDAIPSRDWIGAIVRAFDEVTPRPACVGGRVEPIYEVPLPSWIRDHLLDHLTVIDHAPEPTFLVDIINRQKLASANMAVERAVLASVGGFTPKLDRVGTNLLSGGDVLIQLQIEALGRGVYYDPGIHVHHYVPAGRLTRRWLVERAYWGGVSDALLSYFHRGGGLWWASRTLLWGLRSLVFAPRHALNLRSRSDETTVATCDAWHQVGFVVGGFKAVRFALGRATEI